MVLQVPPSKHTNEKLDVRGFHRPVMGDETPFSSHGFENSSYPSRVPADFVHPIEWSSWIVHAVSYRCIDISGLRHTIMSRPEPSFMTAKFWRTRSVALGSRIPPIRDVILMMDVASSPGMVDASCPG